MPYIIPNATDTTSGNKYVALDQAEPDSIDFEVLGNAASGVMQGLVVTQTTTPGGNVSVSGGTAVLNGLVYTVDENTNFSMTGAPNSGLARFDLIVARLANPSDTKLTLVSLGGTASATNPTLPRSLIRLASPPGDPSPYFNATTDVVVASVYRLQNNPILNSSIVDKRRLIGVPVVYRRTTEPTAATGAVGDLYLRTGALNYGESGLYVKRDSSTWQELAPKFVEPATPIGGLLMWPAAGEPNTSVWRLCNGDLLAKTGTYAALFAVIGTTYGESGSQFRLPNYDGMYLCGVTNNTNLGTAVGNINHQTTLVANNVPSHTHPIDHGHSGGTTSAAGSHFHTPGATGATELFGDTLGNINHDFAVRLRAYASGTYVVPYDKNGDGWFLNQDQGNWVGPQSLNTGSDIPGMATYWATQTSTADNHDHTVAFATSNGLVSGSGGASAPTAVSVQPRSMKIRYYIRYA